MLGLTALLDKVSWSSVRSATKPKNQRFLLVWMSTISMDRITNHIELAGNCWIWVGFSDKANPVLRVSKPKRKVVSARRYSYETHNNVSVPSNYVVTSTCKNSKCVNPAHLTAQKRGGSVSCRQVGFWKPEHCQRGHEFSEWNTGISRSGKRFCIKCDKDHAKAYAAERRHSQPELLKEQRVERWKQRKNWIDRYKADKGCSSCPEKDPVCLDFHHRNPDEKANTIANLVRNTASESVLLTEIAKCDLLCSNCHRKLHAQEREKEAS